MIRYVEPRPFLAFLLILANPISLWKLALILAHEYMKFR